MLREEVAKLGGAESKSSTATLAHTWSLSTQVRSDQGRSDLRPRMINADVGGTGQKGLEGGGQASGGEVQDVVGRDA